MAQHELKECPFCKKKDAYITKNECMLNGCITFSLHHTVSNCVLSEWISHSVFSTEERAARAWNERKAD